MQIKNFLPAGTRCGCFAEPDLAELMRDPMTLALMAADRVDRREFDLLLAGTRRNLHAPRAY